MTTPKIKPSGSGESRGLGSRIGGVRRRLLLLAGLGVAVGAGVATKGVAPALADGRVVGAPLGYSPIDAQSDGVQGYAIGPNNAGTLGRNNDLNGVGVYGAAPSGVAVHGESANGTAVGARSSAGIGVYAASTSNYGVFASSPNSYAIVGISANSYGLNGQSGSSVGMVASSSTSTGAYGYSGTGTGVVGQTGSPSTGGRAGAFWGNVEVYGTFTVYGQKNAAVSHPDGSVRRMHCMESPESYFEDFGTGQLVGGKGQVRIDPDFAVIVKVEEYQVFLTPEGDCKGLYVTAKTPAGFEVRELQGGAASIAFSYRVVSKRKDVTAARLERVVPMKRPDPPKLVSVPNDAGIPGELAPTPVPTSRPAS